MINNYRVEFNIGIHDDFAVKDYPIIREILQLSKQYNIMHIWFFYEPHPEITWLCDNEKDSERLMEDIRLVLINNNITNFKFKTPSDGDFADWWGRNDKENEFGGKVQSYCTDIVALFEDNKELIQNGRGIRKQVERTIHRLCNPLGISYLEEAKICFSRGLICLLFTLFPFNKAVWIYRNIFRQDY